RVETAAGCYQDVELAGSVEHGAAVANAALPVGIEELSTAPFGGGVPPGQLRRGPTGGEFSQRLGREEARVGPFKLGDPVELIRGRLEGVLRVLMNRAQ